MGEMRKTWAKYDEDQRRGFSEEDIWHEMRHLGCSYEQAINGLIQAEQELDD